MKKASAISIFVFLTFILIGNSNAGDVYTQETVEAFLIKECKTKYVILIDEIYEEYSFTRALTKADCTNYKYKSNLFDCDDIAFAVKALVVKHTAEIAESGGAVMFGIAFVEERVIKDSYHIVNIGICKENVYIYDWQEPSKTNVVPIKKYLKDFIIKIIII